MAKKTAAKRGDESAVSAAGASARPVSEAESSGSIEDERWRRGKEILRRAATELAQQRAQSGTAALPDLTLAEGDPFEVITRSLDDPSAQVPGPAVRAFYLLNPELAASFFNRALRDGSPEQRRKIGAALAASGLVSDAIETFKGAGRQNRYRVFSLLFLVAKSGAVGSLISVIEKHPSMELRLALIELLALSREVGIIPVFRRLARSDELPSEVRSAVTDAIYQLSIEAPEGASSPARIANGKS
ncbi:MAG: hypothetical protein ABI967_08115 [bacterium]